MKKQHFFIILFVVLLGFVFAFIQYYQTVKTEDVSAVTVGIPNPGHSLAKLECSADSLCVDTANNRVGIGTNNPSEKLDVNGNISIGYQSNLAFKASNGSYYKFLNVDDGHNGYYTLRYISNGGDSDSNIMHQFLTNSGGTNNTPVMSITRGGKVGIGTTAAPVSLVDIRTTSGSQTLITGMSNTNGIFNLRLGTSIVGYGNGGSVTFVSAGGSDTATIKGTYTNSPSNGGLLEFQNHNGSSLATRMAINGSNVGIGTTSPGYTLTVAGTAWVTSGSWSGSDIRWKKNVSTLSTTTSLDKILKLNPVTYKWKTDEYPEMKFSDGVQLGFIAQDVENIIPEVVTTDNNGYKGISYEKIVPVLTSAIQEQQKEIEQLKTIVCIDHPLEEVCK
jgi:hypothetical protein